MFCKLVGPLNVIWVNLLLCFQQILQPPLAFFYTALWLRITVPTRHFLHYSLVTFYIIFCPMFTVSLANVYKTLCRCLQYPLATFTMPSGHCLQYYGVYNNLWPMFTIPFGLCPNLQKHLAGVYNALWAMFTSPLTNVYNIQYLFSILKISSGRCLQYILVHIYNTLWSTFTIPSGPCL